MDLLEDPEPRRSRRILPELAEDYPANNDEDGEVRIISQFRLPLGRANEPLRELVVSPLPIIRLQPQLDDHIDMNIQIPSPQIIPQVLENVGDIQMIDDVDAVNVANIVEVQAINENPQEIVPDLYEIVPQILQFPEIIGIDESTASSATGSEAQESEEEKPRKKRKLEIIKPKIETQNNEDSDEGRVCPICMEAWTNSGEHRLCSLACGHLFGHKCVLRWLKQECTSQNRRCPHCNTKAQTKDIRMIYTTNLSAVDTIELERLKNELQSIVSKNKSLETELSTSLLRYRVSQDEVNQLKQKIEILEKEKQGYKVELKGKGFDRIAQNIRKFHLDKTFEIARDGGCRVLDYNSWYGYLAVSQKSTNTLFPGYGVRKIDINKYEQLQFTLLHTQVIRDMSFHPTEQSLLLSVGFDKTAKMMDIHNNQVVHAYPVESQVWSCCWAGDNPNIFVVGTQKGIITQFDIRRTSGAIDTLDNPGDRSPIVSLASVPSCSANGIPRGGFLACHLNTCYAYELRNNVYAPKRILYDGPFTCVRYDSQNHHALISCRPNSTNKQARHIVFAIERGVSEDSVACNTAHTLHAGTTSNLLSRPCHVNFGDDTFIAAHQESTKSIPIWSVTSGKEVQNISVSNPVVDMCSFHLKNSVLLGALSADKLRIYNCDLP